MGGSELVGEALADSETDAARYGLARGEQLLAERQREIARRQEVPACWLPSLGRRAGFRARRRSTGRMPCCSRLTEQK